MPDGNEGEKTESASVLYPSYGVRTDRVGVKTNKNGNQMHTFGSIARDSLLLTLGLEGHSVQ